MIILDEFVDFIKVIRIKMIAFYAEMSLDRFGKELRFISVGLGDFVRVVQSWIVTLTLRLKEVLKGSVTFYQEGGLLKIRGIRYFFLDQKVGSKDFFKLKRGDHLYFFKKIKYFVKHFRTQMEFLLILQKSCSFDSVSCWNSSKRG